MCVTAVVLSVGEGAAKLLSVGRRQTPAKINFMPVGGGVGSGSLLPYAAFSLSSV